MLYSLESSCGVISDEYPCARVSDFFLGFLHYLVLAKLATGSIRVNHLKIEVISLHDYGLLLDFL